MNIYVEDGGNYGKSLEKRNLLGISQRHIDNASDCLGESSSTELSTVYIFSRLLVQFLFYLPYVFIHPTPTQLFLRSPLCDLFCSEASISSHACVHHMTSFIFQMHGTVSQVLPVYTVHFTIFFFSIQH